MSEKEPSFIDDQQFLFTDLTPKQIAALDRMEKAQGEGMSKRRTPFDRKQQLKAVLAYAKGLSTLKSAPNQRINAITLPKINGPTMAEIEAKYGPIDRTQHEQN